MKFTHLTEGLIQQLTEIAGDANVSSAEAVRSQYALDQSQYEPHLAEVVVWATSAQQVADVLRFANEHTIPVTAWGAGTSLEGNPLPLHGGISINFERMNQIVEVHADDFQVTVQPGIGHYDLNEHLARYGLFFAPDPGANASIGGMLANNASGIRTVKFGATRDNVLRMQVALADGRLIEVGSRSAKQSSGYDLRHLFIGSEGTLGIITEATLKLAPIAEHASAVLAFFPTITAAIETVVAVRGSGLEPAALEFIDTAHARMLSEVDGVDLEPTPTLFMEFQSNSKRSLEEGLATTRELCEEFGATSFRATTDPAERKQLWHARHSAYEIQVRNHPGQKIFVGDVAVPISAIPAMTRFVEEKLAEMNTAGYLLGHAGDGNVHLTVPFTAETYETAKAIHAAVVEKAIELGGTATGEHGVGITKRDYMQREHGPALDVMRAIKQTLDPKGILNPGKIFPVP